MSDSDSISAIHAPPEYRDVVGFPGYRVGSDGTVWTRWRRGRKWGLGPLTDFWRELKQSIDSGKRSDCDTDRPPYHRVVLYRDGKRFTKKVHHLVLEAFIGQCPPGLEARHLDGNHENNNRGNLEWGTKSDNWDDKRLHGTATMGDKNGKTYLTDSQVQQIKIKYASGAKPRHLADEFHATLACIYGIVYEKNRKHA